MATIQSVNVDLFDLLLDADNPRFIVPPNASQQDIREYLLQYEEIEDLASGIVEHGGLMLGERVIACEEGGSYVVLEGNRRVCACQLLSNPSLLPGSVASFPTATSGIMASIMTIPVDVAESRDAAFKILATRHIKGIRQWSPIPKRRFSANRFEAGKTIDEIVQITQLSRQEVIKDIREYYLVMYMVGLQEWTDRKSVV